jgi:hypothetical protein
LEDQLRDQLISAFGRKVYPTTEERITDGNGDNSGAEYTEENSSDEPELFTIQVGNTAQEKRRSSRGKGGRKPRTNGVEIGESEAQSPPVSTPEIKAKPKSKAAAAKSKAEGKETAQMLIEMLNSVLETSMGTEAQLNRNERGFIEPPLGRLIDKYSPSQIEKFSLIADPLLLAVGLGIWFMRVRNNVTIPNPLQREEKPTIVEETASSVEYNPAAKFSAPSPEELAQWMNS